MKLGWRTGFGPEQNPLTFGSDGNKETLSDRDIFISFSGNKEKKKNCLNRGEIQERHSELKLLFNMCNFRKHDEVNV